MCPFCIANLTLLIAGVATTGGATALLTKKISAITRRKKRQTVFSNRAAVSADNRRLGVSRS
jgi:hypothetical protein